MTQREISPGHLRNELEELLARQKRPETLRIEAEHNAARLAREREELLARLKNLYRTLRSAGVLVDHFLNNQQQETERRKQAERQAQTDPLTGLPNRRGFEAAMDKLKRFGDKGVILVLDVDEFKKYNDTYGHLVGDRVLLKIAEFLKTHIRQDDIAARWAGDEFIVYFRGTTANAVLNKFRLPKELSTKTKQFGVAIPLTVEVTKGGQTQTTQLQITLSGGLVDFNLSLEDFDSAFKKADMALYEVKKSGRGHFKIYCPQKSNKKTGRPKQQNSRS